MSKIIYTNQNKSHQLTEQIISRADAINERLKIYLTGKPCKNGHVSHRRTCRGICVECYKEWYQANPEYNYVVKTIHIKYRNMLAFTTHY